MNEISVMGGSRSICHIFAGAHHVAAASDLSHSSLMYDGTELYPSFHPVQLNMTPDNKRPLGHQSRTARPPTYHIIDFGMSKAFSTEDLQSPLEENDHRSPVRRERDSASSRRSQTRRMLSVDVCCLGTFARDELLQVSFVLYLCVRC